MKKCIYPLIKSLGVLVSVLTCSFSQHTKAQCSGVNSQDSAALVTLYNVTDGANWDNNSNWLQGTIDTWSGVTLTSDGCSVLQLSLPNNGLVGEIPSDLGDLSSLTYLNLIHNQLNGSIPSELGNLTNLTQLYLNNNELSGSIPSELGNLTNLTHLQLSYNQLNGGIPWQLGNLSSLTDLMLISNDLSGIIPSELGSLTNLSKIGLQSNQLNGDIPSELGSLMNLTHLYLNHNNLSGVIPWQLGNLINLTNLSLSYNGLSGDIPSELGSLMNLTHLYLSHNNLSGVIPWQLGNLTNLVHFHLYNNQLNGVIPWQLGNLINLNHLQLNDNQLSGGIPSEFGNLTNLTRFHLYNNQLSGCIPSSLQMLCSDNVAIGSIGNNPDLETQDWSAFCSNNEGICSSQSCPYALRSVDLECAFVGDTICVWLDAVVPVDNNITGLNYTVQFDNTLLTPTGNATLGDVVLNSGLYTQGIDAEITTNLDFPGYVVTTINYLDTYTFEPITGEVLCIEFVLTGTINSTTSSLFNYVELREAKGAILEDECVDDGLLNIQAIENYLDLKLVFAHDTDTIIDNGNPSPGANTTFAFMDTTCLDSLFTDAPDTNGVYAGNIGGATRVKIRRDIEPDNYYTSLCQVNIGGGILNGVDALMSKLVNNFDVTSPPALFLFPSGIPTLAQMIAMDVNRNGEIDGDDVTQVQSRSIGSICEFQQLDNYDFSGVTFTPLLPYVESYDWVFVDASWLTNDPAYVAHSNYPNFPVNVSNPGYWRDHVPVPDQCFDLCPTGDCCLDAFSFELQGILVGDANGTWHTGTSFKDEGTNHLIFDMNNVENLGSGKYRIPVRYDAENMAYVIDFGMDYDETKMQIDHVILGDEAVDAQLAMDYNDFNEEELRLTSFTTGGIDTDAPVFFIEVSLLDESDELFLTDLGEITGLVFTLDNATTEVSSIALGIEDSNVGSNHLSGVRAYPNPVNNRLVIDLPADLNTNSAIVVRNILGQVIFQTNTSDKRTLVDMAERAAGVYLVSIETAEGLQDHIRVVKQ